jgi:DNA-binding NarL/FixJ family response regulator
MKPQPFDFNEGILMRILIADPEPKVRRALTVLLHEQTGWYVVGHAGTL